MKKFASPPHTDGSIVFARFHKCAHPSNASLDPPESTSQTTSRSVQPILAQITAQSPYTS